VLMPDGTFDALEYDANVNLGPAAPGDLLLVHRALVSGEAVVADRYALEHAGWVEKDRAKSPAPEVRGEFCEYLVLINGNEVEKGHILQRLEVEQRRGQSTVSLRSRVTVHTPMPGEPNRKTPFTVPVEATTSMSDIHRRRFREAVRKVTREGVSAWTRAQLGAQHLHSLAAMHHAARDGDVDQLSALLQRSVSQYSAGAAAADVNALTADGMSGTWSCAAISCASMYFSMTQVRLV
jgi:hypothetical protein